MTPHRSMFALLSVLAVLPVLGAPPKPLSFDEKSRDALVIVEVAPQDIVEKWSLLMRGYSLDSKKFVGSIYKGATALFAVEGEGGSRRFVAAVVKRAGTHVMYLLNTQVYWGACFDKAAQAFTFEPGKVYFLGTIDPTGPLMHMVLELPKTLSQSQWVFGMRLPYTPPARRKDWEQDVATFVAENFPAVKAPVLAAEAVEVAFQPAMAPKGNAICRDKY